MAIREIGIDHELLQPGAAGEVLQHIGERRR